MVVVRLPVGDHEAGVREGLEDVDVEALVVLCALALVREAADGEIDLVILASHDSDLRPALDEALRLGSAKIETTTWHDPEHPGWCRPLRPDDEKRRLWNTKLGETQFQRCLDLRRLRART